MPLTLHLHPLSSFCQKVLIGLYENGAAFAAKPFMQYFPLADALPARFRA